MTSLWPRNQVSTAIALMWLLASALFMRQSLPQLCTERPAVHGALRFFPVSHHVPFPGLPLFWAGADH